MSETPPTPTRRRRRFRWYTRLAIVIACVVVATLAIAQGLFWSDVPRKIVQAQIGSILHVQAKLGSLRIGWLGGVDVRDLTLQLPTETAPFLTVDRAHLKLAPLFVIAFDQEVRDVQADGVDVALRQLPNGRWNVQQWLASGTGPSPTPSEPLNPARLLAILPTVRLTNARVVATKSDGKTLALPDVRLTLARSAPLTLSLDAHVGDEITASASVAGLGTAPHELHVTIANPPAGLGEFLGVKLSTPADATLSWTGRLLPGGVTGTLTIDRAAYDVARASGTIDVTAGGADALVVARPTDVTLAVAAATQPTSQPTTQSADVEIRVTNGAIRYDGQVRVDAIRGTANGGGRFAVDGHADVNTLAGEFNAAWEDVAQGALTTTGHAMLKTTPQFTGKLLVAAGAGASATLPAGAASGTVALSGEGTGIDAFDGTLTIQPLTWTPTRGAPIVTPPLVGDVSGRGTDVALHDLHSTDASIGTLTASGVFDRATQAWWATLDARGLKLPPVEAMGVKYPIDADASAFGTRGEHATIQQLYAKSGPAQAWATGVFEKDRPKPVRLETWAWLDRPATDDEAAHLNSLTAVGIVEGTREPLAIDADMQVAASQLVVGGRSIGDLAVQIVGRATRDHATLQSREMDLLGGTWSLNALWDRDATPMPMATLDFHKLPLARLGDVAKLSGVGGTIDEGHVVLRLDATALDQIEATASATGSDLSYAPAGANAARLTADTLTLAASLRAGDFKAVPILRNGTGTLTAELDGNVALKDPIRLGATLTDWPAPERSPTTAPTTRSTTEVAAATRPARIVPRASATLDAQVTLDAHWAPLRSAMKLTAAADRGPLRLADVSVDALANGGLITLRDATVHTLDGVLRASGHVDVANLNGATFDAKFERLAPAELAWLPPPFGDLLADLAGRFSGTATVGPAAGPRPLGPVQLTLAVRPDAAHFRSVDVGDLDCTAFASFESPAKFRIVTDTATLHVADGTLMPFVRYSYDASVGPSQLVTVTFDRLDLGQLDRAIDDDGKPLVGRVAGSVRVYGAATSLDTVNGEATLSITDSDLANVGPVALLYNVLNVGSAGRDPTGAGSVNVRIESGVLSVVDATYFNRGVYATAYGPVRHVDRLADAEIDHLKLIGSLQPFRDTKLPFFGDLNDTLAALQQSAVAIDVSGTAKEPVARQVGLSELGSAVQGFLFGKTK